MARILVTEKLAPKGLEAMGAAGHEVDVFLGLSPEELIEVIPGYQALVIRSSTKVVPAVLEAGRDLVVVGRAGVGLDNVDVPAATSYGVMVVNAPESNILSAAEHAMALLLAMARNVPQSHAALVAGRWERSKWEGIELHHKTLGILGLGRIGALVAQRAHSFGMRLIAHDPYISAERAKMMGVELVELDDLVGQSDFLTIHLPKTPETAGLVGKELLAKAKRGIRIVNAARGGVLDEKAVAEAIATGQVGGVALDVFSSEPCTDSPLFALPQVVVTPHLGASTAEAQDKAGEQIAEQIVLALAGDFVPYAVNLAARGASEAVRPYLGLTERLGRCLAALCDGLPAPVEVTYAGALAGEDTGILTLSLLKGIFAAGTEEPVSYVNAPRLAAERGLEIVESSTATTHDYVSLVTVRSGDHSISGTLAGPGKSPAERIVMIDDHAVDVPFADNLLVVRNDDRPGMVGAVGSALGEAELSILSMAVGQSPVAETALMALSTDRPVSTELLARLRGSEGILGAHRLLTAGD
ncbi:MAG: phosphoglycerate dehydrogenase [Acidimicrobiales bacterium]